MCTPRRTRSQEAAYCITLMEWAFLLPPHTVSPFSLGNEGLRNPCRKILEGDKLEKGGRPPLLRNTEYPFCDIRANRYLSNKFRDNCAIGIRYSQFPVPFSSNHTVSNAFNPTRVHIVDPPQTRCPPHFYRSWTAPNTVHRVSKPTTADVTDGDNDSYGNTVPNLSYAQTNVYSLAHANRDERYSRIKTNKQTRAKKTKTKSVVYILNLEFQMYALLLVTC